MKIRILNNSIRFRLSISDVQALREEGEIRSYLTVSPGKSLSFGLIKNNAITTIQADHSVHFLCFLIPSAQVADFHQSDKVGIYETVHISESEMLKITIEKDFKCLTARSEDESDLFPNPKEHH